MRLAQVLMLACVSASADYAAKAEPHLALWYARPAARWLEALPIGNGRIGGMVYGGTANERVQFNEQSLWLGSETEMGSYQPFGDLLIHWKHGVATEYRRELDLDAAIHRVSYQADGWHYQSEAFCSNPDQVLVYRFTASEPRAFTGTIHLTDAHNAAISAAGNKIASAGQLDNGMAYEAQLRVVCDGGTVKSGDNKLAIVGANSVTLLLAAGTSFANDPHQHWQGEHPHARVARQLDQAAEKTYRQLKATHVEDYQHLFHRVTLTLNGSDSHLPTDERLSARAAVGVDPQLDALLFHYGRYLLISSSRPGGLPANLQGIWNQDTKPAWYSGYTANINLQMNYWPAEPTGLSECAEPLFQYIRNLAVVYKRTRDEIVKPPKGRGWSAYSTTNPFGGSSRWGVHRPHSAWLVQHLWEHYAFTGDTEFLRSSGYPAMREVVEFWEDRLIQGPNGTLITPDGWSPEHGPVAENGKTVLKEGDRTPHPGTTYDQEIVWDLFNNFVDASAVLGVDGMYAAKISSMRDRLLMPRTGRWGQLQEWMEDVDDPHDKHRHTSHLFAVFPGRQISSHTNPELAQAASVSLNARGNYSTGWSKAWRLCLWARLGNNERVDQLLTSFVKPIDESRNTRPHTYDGGFYPNLFDGHPPFQIDGNFGYTAAVCEMLLQSHLMQDGRRHLELLPALPASWPDGEVMGLCARGGYTVDIAWTQGRLAKATVVSRYGTPAILRYRDDLRLVDIDEDERYYWE